MKAYGLGGRARLFEVVEKMREVNYERRKAIGFRPFTGKSYRAKELLEHPDWEADYIAATPRMAEYIRVSSEIYGIYLKYIAPEDIHVYSIDEIFADVTDYLQSYKMTRHRHEPLSLQGGDGRGGEAYPGRQGRGAHSRTRRDELP